MIKIILMGHIKTIILSVRPRKFCRTMFKRETGTYLRFPVYFFCYFCTSSWANKCGHNTGIHLQEKTTALESKSCFLQTFNICNLSVKKERCFIYQENQNIVLIFLINQCCFHHLKLSHIPVLSLFTLFKSITKA